MNKNQSFIFLFIFTAVVFVTERHLFAEPIQAGQTTFSFRAIQDVTLFANTPINPGAELTVPGFLGEGFFTLQREAQAGDTIDYQMVGGTVAFGELAGLGAYRFGAVGPYVPNDFTGQITNIVQDPADPGFATGDSSSLASGDFTFESAGFALEFTSGPLTGVILETDTTQSFGFESTWDSLPPSPGTVITGVGDDTINVLFGGTVVGTTSNRRLIVTVPEPTLPVMLPWLCALMAGIRRLR